jgi:hypothetical protein
MINPRGYTYRKTKNFQISEIKRIVRDRINIRLINCAPFLIMSLPPMRLPATLDTANGILSIYKTFPCHANATKLPMPVVKLKTLAVAEACTNPVPISN